MSGKRTGVTPDDDLKWLTADHKYVTIWCYQETKSLGHVGHQTFIHKYGGARVRFGFPTELGSHQVKVRCPFCGEEIERAVHVTNKERSIPGARWLWGLVFAPLCWMFGAALLIDYRYGRNSYRAPAVAFFVLPFVTAWGAGALARRFMRPGLRGNVSGVIPKGKLRSSGPNANLAQHVISEDESC